MSAIAAVILVLQSFSVSLGVGSSTLAIINFFVAIQDGKIDPTERRMMGVVYIVLRVAMVAILLTTLGLLGMEYLMFGSLELTAVIFAQLIVLAVLYINAILMTVKVMPSTFGPALQAGSWYTLGLLGALQILQIDSFPIWQFLFGYLTWLVLAVAIVNGIMALVTPKKT